MLSIFNLHRMKETIRIATFQNRYNRLFMMFENNNLSKGIVEDAMNRNRIPKMQINKIMNNRIRLEKLKQFALVALMLVLGVSVGRAQDTLLVKGKVVNGLNQPVANVAIAIEGSYELPVVTGEDGSFTLKTKSGKIWLNVEASSMYKTKRVFLNNRSYLTIYLTGDDMVSGDDQVRILSQRLRRKNVVASFDEVNTQKIFHTPALSIDQYMQGRVSGLHVVNRSGDPGSGAFSLLRGVNSLNANTQPLYVVDGIPITSLGVFESNLEGFTYNPLLGVNPFDVSKITVVKDPTVTTAYGSKASNGVVLIETLDPTATETVIDFDLRYGYSLSPERQIPQLNAGQHKTLMSEVLFSSGEREERIRLTHPMLFLRPSEEGYVNYSHNTNWQNEIFSDAAFSNLNVNVKGGDEIARYGISFGYLNGDGIIKSTGYQGYNIRFVGMLNIFTWLRMNTGVAMSYNSSEMKESGKVNETSPILAGLGKSPLLNPFQYDDDGNRLSVLANVDALGVSNPKAVIDNYSASNTNFNFTTNMGLQAIFSPDFSVNSNFGLTYNLLKENIFMPNTGMERYYNQEAYNVAKASNNGLFNFYNNTYILYTKTFGNNHRISSSTGVNTMTNNFEFDWGLTKNSHQNDQYRMLQDGTNSLREIGGSNRRWNWVSLYESFNYSFQDRYLLSAALSVDGSSRVGVDAANTFTVFDAPFGLFYAVGGGWRLSSESFLKNLSWLEEFKLRASYGKSGNDDIGESSASRYYDAVRFRTTTGLLPAVFPNEQLSYETVNQLNGGLDLALFGNRVTAKVDIYKSTVNDMLIYSPMEAYFGFNYRAENNGKMENKGIDANLFVRIVDQRNFKWDVQATYSAFTNEILEISGNRLITDILGAQTVNMVGETANSFYGYIFEGVYSTTDEAHASGLRNETLNLYHGGDAKFKDISGPMGEPDGIINNYDKTVIGSSVPDFFGGFRNSFNFKRWSLDAFIQAVVGNEVFNYIRYKNESMTGLQNQSTSVLNRWQYEGQVTEIPRALYNDPIGNSSFSTRWIEDGSYLRVKNVTLSYTIPDKFIAFRRAQFYVSANNIFTFSKYIGYDPEFGYSLSQMDNGIDYGQTPQARQFVMGVKLGL